MRFHIVNTDNFPNDYPDESLLVLRDSDGRHQPFTFYDKTKADKVCAALNNIVRADHATRWWKVVSAPYQLKPGFEP